MLSRGTIVTALAHLSVELEKDGVLGEINVVWGTAMVLAFNARNSTKDVDAIFEPSWQVRSAAGRVAENLALPADWLDDAAKGFMPLAVLNLPNLRVQAPTPDYMLAMKVLAARAGGGTERGDKQDIAFLIRTLGLTSAGEVMDIVTRYYDPEILEEMRP